MIKKIDPGYAAIIAALITLLGYKIFGSAPTTPPAHTTFLNLIFGDGNGSGNRVDKSTNVTEIQLFPVAEKGAPNSKSPDRGSGNAPTATVPQDMPPESTDMSTQPQDIPVASTGTSTQLQYIPTTLSTTVILQSATSKSKSPPAKPAPPNLILVP